MPVACSLLSVVTFPQVPWELDLSVLGVLPILPFPPSTPPSPHPGRRRSPLGLAQRTWRVLAVGCEHCRPTENSFLDEPARKQARLRKGGAVRFPHRAFPLFPPTTTTTPRPVRSLLFVRVRFHSFNPSQHSTTTTTCFAQCYTLFSNIILHRI